MDGKFISKKIVGAKSISGKHLAQKPYGKSYVTNSDQLYPGLLRTVLLKRMAR